MGILRQSKHQLLYKLVRSFFDQVQTVSDEVRQYTIRQDGVRPERVRTIHNGIEFDSVGHHEPLEPGLEEKLAGKLVVATVANWRRVKGIDVLVNAVPYALQQVPDAHFVVAGRFGESVADKSFTQEVLQSSSSRGLDEHISFLGAFNRVPALLKRSHLFVLPSRSEGLSNALLEAMRAGLPCVATAVGGNPEVVVDDVTGRLVPPEDANALASAIVSLLQDGKLRQGMGTAGRARVQTEFEASNMVRKVIESYREALQRH
jgi:glycosyltransferase involved in cell wall biosynthesis